MERKKQTNYMKMPQIRLADHKPKKKDWKEDQDKYLNYLLQLNKDKRVRPLKKIDLKTTTTRQLVDLMSSFEQDVAYCGDEEGIIRI